MFALQEAYDIEDIAHVLMVDRAARIEREAALVAALQVAVDVLLDGGSMDAALALASAVGVTPRSP